MNDFLEILAYTRSDSSGYSNLFWSVVLAFLIVSLIYRRIKKTSQTNMADLTLVVDETTTQPGQVLEAAVELVPKKDFQIRRAVAQLVRVETYVVKKSSGRSGTSYHKSTLEESMAEEVFILDQDVQAMDSIVTTVEFLVPQYALPTMQGKTTRGITPGVSWMVQSEFDIASKFDLEEEQEIIVHMPPKVDTLPYRPVVAESEHSMSTITMSIHTADVYKGSNFEGILRAEMNKDTNISGVVIKLEGTEKFGDVSTSLDIDEVVFDVDTTLHAGRIYDWPFQLDTSKANMPSLQLIKSKVEYSITGRLDISMRRDPSVTQDVNIFI